MKNKYIIATLASISISMSTSICQMFAQPAETLNIGISAKNMSESGILSAYIQHEFTLDKGSLAITDPQWTLTLPLNNGDFEYLSLNDDAFSCITKELDFASSYKTDADGIMEARLQFTGILNGIEITTEPFNFYFDLKPVIEYAVIEKIEDESPYPSYNAYYKVKYLGAEKIRIAVEEEFGGMIKSTYLYEPYIAYGCAEHIKAPYMAWIDFEAKNNYGKATYTIELLPYGEVTNSVDNIFEDISGSPFEYRAIEVYDTHGKKIADVDDISLVSQLSIKGILIIKATTVSGEIKTLKIMNR